MYLLITIDISNNSKSEIRAQSSIKSFTFNICGVEVEKSCSASVSVVPDVLFLLICVAVCLKNDLSASNQALPNFIIYNFFATDGLGNIGSELNH